VVSLSVNQMLVQKKFECMAMKYDLIVANLIQRLLKIFCH